MANEYIGGAVSARVELDITDFTEKLEVLKGKVKDLQKNLQKTGLSNITEQLKEFQGTINSQQKTIDKLEDTIKDYKKQLKSLRQELKNGTKESRNNKNAFKDLSKETNILVI